MNFTSRTEDPRVRVELKYCERCGGLFLRRLAEERVYCADCMVHLARQMDPGETPSKALRGKLRGRRRARNTGADRGQLGNTGHVECLQGVAEMGVWA